MSRVSGTNAVSDGNETNDSGPVSRVSGTNAVSDGNETNDSGPVSRVSGTNAVSDGNETNDSSPVTDESHEPAPVEVEAQEPVIHVLKGEPTAEDLAALVAVLGAASGAGGEPAPAEITRWGLPVDNLRFGPFSWQKITLLERTHMRR
ncbi:acyl-CoA carboxylase epsilon subunit [Mycobacterium cookii]|uniref:acyl-CoA carboxylase epsilon subunit n=1 Tax=Mycobacterium cookii TaxID=1775 RepID=UPI0013D50DC5